MKLQAVLLIFSLLFISLNSCALAWSANDAIRGKIEEFRSLMPCGINGGPPLVPFQHEQLDIDLDIDMIR